MEYRNETYDIFISYRRADSGRVLPLVEALKGRDLKVWMDQREIEDFAGITASIREGLSNSKALVAWFSAIYPLSRPCQWELTVAFIAAQQEGDLRKRVLIINLEQSPDHIYLPELNDQEYLVAPAQGDSKGYEEIADRLAKQLSGISGTLGDIRTLIGPQWYPTQATGSTRFVGRLREMWKIHGGTGACHGTFFFIGGIIFPHIKWLRPQKAVWEYVYKAVIAAAGYLLSNLHLQVFDPLFIRQGKLDRLLKMK